MRRHTLFLCSVALALGLWPAFSRSACAAPEGLRDRLITMGYSDVGLTSGQTAVVTFANQTHRRLAVALGEVLMIATQELPTAQRIVLVPQFDRIPIGSLEVTREAYRQWSSGALNDKAFLGTMRIERRVVEVDTDRAATSRFWSDLSLYPAATLEYGAAIGVQEAWRIGLGDGASFEAIAQQAIAKVGRDLPAVPLANLLLSRWLTPTIPGMLRIGYFGARGWGGQAELGLPLGPAELRLIGGGTGLSDVEAISRVYWRTGLMSIALRAGFGRFLDGDWGYEGSVLRAFDRSTLEGTALKTTHGLDIRMVLTIHLGGVARPMPSAFRFEPGTWRIYYQPENFKIGRTLLFSDDLEEFFMDLYPDELQRCLPNWPKLLEGARAS